MKENRPDISFCENILWLSVDKQEKEINRN